MNPMPALRALALAASCAALIASPGPQTPETGQAAAGETPSAGMTSRLILVQHASPNHLRELLRPLLSDSHGSTIDAMDRDDIRAITVRDFPENIAAIEAAVKRLDVENPARRQVEFHIHVLLASKQDGQGGAVPDELQDVLASLKSTLSYRSYAPVASFVQRAADGAELIEGEGQAEMAVRMPKGETAVQPMDLSWGIYRLSLGEASPGMATITFPKFQLMAWDHAGTGHGARLASLETNLSLKSGEKVVVGTSIIRDKALIVVLTAKVLD